MKNFVQPGETLTLVAPYDVLAGGGALIGLVFGIAGNSYASGAAGEFVTEGVFDITALGTDTASATPVAAYWDDSNKRITTTASGNTKVGVIIKAKVNGDTTARVRLNSTF